MISETSLITYSVLRKSFHQCCHIWQFIANLATFDTNLLQKFPFGYLVFLAIFFGYFWKFGKKLVLNQFKTGFGSISLCLDVDIFAFWKSFDVDILGFQKCFDVDLLGFSKIWLLFAQTFWQHWFSLQNLLMHRVAWYNFAFNPTCNPLIKFNLNPRISWALSYK